ncbi:uncharacterized protein [Nicotiana tomentosiformis]|uniref:uncharacterized protein n=1 Tax=Nicotiana tomentosiformis TaxID=4098 RepID=UPI00388CE9B8
MAKGVRSNDTSTEEPGNLRELIQKLIANVGALFGEEHLTHSGENRRDKTPIQYEGEPSDKRSPRKKSPASYNHHNSNFSSRSRMKFLRFNGEDLKSWLFKIEQFFSTEKVPAEERVEVVAMQLKGEAIQWHLAFMRYRQYLQSATWTEYVVALVEKFGVDFDDPMEEIKKIRQTGTVKEYQAVFERNLTGVNLSQENTISYFFGGLKHELNIAVKLINPTTLSQVYKTARMQEAYLAAIRQPSSVSNTPTSGPRRIMDQRNNNRPLLPTPSQGNAGTSKGFNRRSLSLDEMNEKRAKGLCYFCNEKYVVGHKCKNLKQIYLLELEESEEGVFSEESVNELEEHEMELSQPMEQMEISIHALNGSLGYMTLRVTGYHSQKPLHILVDTESSHNFMDPELVERLKLSVRAITPQLVAAANGNMLKVDKVCKISWLLQGAEFSAEFLLLPLGSCGGGTRSSMVINIGGYQNKLQNTHHGILLQRKEALQCCSFETKETFEQDPSLLNLLNEFRELFKEPTQLPPSRGVFDLRIVLQDRTKPINKRPYRYPSVKKDVIETLVKQMLDQEDLLDELGGSEIFSKIDLRSDYHQLRMEVEDVPKTAFRTHASHYEYLVMLFGLSNAPATFQGLMNSVFQKFLRKAKCFFGVQKIEYLGHFITVEGVSTDPQKVEAVKEWPLPTNVKQLRRFLRLAGYYRRFIRGFGSISKPLTDLLKKDNFKWSLAASEAFEQLKTALIQAPVLALPDAHKTFIVETDASGHGIGAVLMQQGHHIAFISRALSPRHAALSVYKRELLTIVHVVTKWSQYLLGQKFIIRTDHKALKFLIEQKLHKNSQLMWLTKLMPFDYVIEYKR